MEKTEKSKLFDEIHLSRVKDAELIRYKIDFYLEKSGANSGN